MVDQTVAKIAAFLGRNDLPQGHFHLFRVLAILHQPNAVAQANAMGVGYNGRLAEHIAHDQIGAFAPHAGQAQKGVEIIGHLAAIFVLQHLHAGADIARFAAPKAAGLYNGLNLLHRGFGQSLHRGIFGIQPLHHHIHARIGALGGQTHRNQQLPRIVIIQRAACIGISLLQQRNGLQCAFFFGHGETLSFHFIMDKGSTVPAVPVLRISLKRL